VETLRGLHEAFPAVELVVTYSDLTPPALHAAVQAGLTGLVPCAHGLEAVLRMLRQRAAPLGRGAPDGLALTDRELGIMSLLGAGHSVPEMAELLGISPRTVENHKRHLYAKLGVGTQSHAVSRAASLGLLQPVGDAEATLWPTAEDGRDPLVVVGGAPGECLDEVVLALSTRGLPFVYAARRLPLNQANWAGWHRGPLTAVLVDPQTDDWLLPTALGVAAVVVHSTDPTLAMVVDALLRGAHALLRGDQVSADLEPVLSMVGRGYFTMSAERLGELTDWMWLRLAERPSGLPELTARECDILGSIASGHTVRQTARALGIAAKTVENTQARLFRKLGARNRAGALTIAYRLGLIDPTVAAHPPPALGSPPVQRKGSG
jgi:DNA-binding CsgD family transcriptional regulator